jgi:hypothetical protein
LAWAKEATRRRNATLICRRHTADKTPEPAVGEELNHLTADLQLAEVAVEPVQAVEVQRDMASQRVVDRDHALMHRR